MQYSKFPSSCTDSYLCTAIRLSLQLALNMKKFTYDLEKGGCFLWITVAKSQHFTTSFSAALPYQIRE
jgi:hypothetical protein